MYQKLTLKKMLICIVILCILVAGVVVAGQQQEENRKQNDIITFHTGDKPGIYVEVNCYPVLQGKRVKVEDKERIASLSEELDEKEFSYLGAQKKLQKKYEGLVGGYSSHFKVYSENGDLLYSFGYNGNYDGYIVLRNSSVYRLRDDAAGLEEICGQIIKLAEKQIE